MPEKLAEIQRLAMLTVSFERKKKSSEHSQCYRCQRYGHTQRNCRLAERMMNSKGIQFAKARTTGTSVKVFTNTPADCRQLVALLESIKRPFFTYQLKEDRMDQRVIRGLPREMSVNDIKEDLVSQGIADAEVQQMTSRTTKKPLPLFLVKTKMPEKLAEIQRLAMLTVSFERKKKSSEPSQCYRCQRYGHTQRNCRLAERCVKCGEDHNSTSCSLPAPPTGQRNAKSGRDTYGYDAIGYVQLKRERGICIVKFRIMPEHRVKSKPCHCRFECDEKGDTVIKLQCSGCAAQEGGCKHGVLMWLHRRSKELPCTSVNTDNPPSLPERPGARGHTVASSAMTPSSVHEEATQSVATVAEKLCDVNDPGSSVVLLRTLNLQVIDFDGDTHS
ncbi:unnamed protein product [Acanthoscelides obtectus]|uniref:CCHC-type domain-containing protein n=1 Tax=Acanthoscelides obtectus TaxID=200917 RepID=A0A9P0VRP9_ACAOB|nr:unnamed protein product [Acanthoscelides obtectus]CAK1648146.1 Nucleic-acid-binding protein from transposon X-element [Acanthoscelides obtectus]